MKSRFAIFLILFLLTGGASAQTSSIRLAVEASRTSGVAPLMVFFDASGTTDPGVTYRPFREIEYRWNFGDIDTRWQSGSRAGTSRKNLATGPLAGHVFENPGTYTVTLSAFDGVTTATRQLTITVADPDTVFAGSSTICFSNGVLGFDGCPDGALQVRTQDFAAAINGYKGPGRRLLFRRGETFSAYRAASIGVDGPGIIGAFGPPSEPKPVLWNTVNGNAIQFSSPKTPDVRDWRIMDLTLLGSGQNQSFGVAFVAGISQVTLLRLSVRRQRVAFMADAFILDHLNSQSTTAGHRIWDQIAVVDSDVFEVNRSTAASEKGYGAYLSGDRIFFAGNMIDNAGTAIADVSHATRFTYLGKSVISNNTLMNPGPTEHLIKLHAPLWGDTRTENTGVGKGSTRWVVISDNKFVGANNAWLVAVGPQNGSRDERVMEVVVERNWFVGGPGMQIAHIYWASAVTIRNNIVDSSGGSRWQGGVLTVGRRGVEPRPERIAIFNESYYTTRRFEGGLFAAIRLEAAAWDVTVKNNLAYAPNAAAPTMFSNLCGACLIQSNNSTDTLIRTSQPFVLAWPDKPVDFAAAGYATGSGGWVPSFSDFFLAPQRAQRRDLGAVSANWASLQISRLGEE